MKKKIILTLSFALLLNAAPVASFAESIDDKINAQNQKINDIISNQKEAKEYLNTLEAEISALEDEYNAVLAEKQETEQKINDMNASIADLETKIEKRHNQLEAQARATQTDNSSTSVLSVMLNANSLSDAISKFLAVNTIVSANNDVIQAQKADKDELNALKADLITQAEALEAKTKELAEKEEIVVQAKLDQDVKLNEIAASLAKETAEKEQFEKQKEEAERKRQEELREAAERKRKMAEAQALAEQQAKEQAAAAAAKAEQEAATAAANQAQQATETVPETSASQPQDSSSQENSSSTGTGATAPSSSGWAMPIASGVITSGFGHREDPTGISGTFHDGIDFGGSTSTVIMASRAGTVVTAGYGGMAGNHVVINHGDGFYSYYLHMSSLSVSQGQTVSQGQQLGYMGTTGNSTGVHLHFSISTGLWSGFVDPSGYL